MLFEETWRILGLFPEKSLKYFFDQVLGFLAS